MSPKRQSPEGSPVSEEKRRHHSDDNDDWDDFLSSSGVMTELDRLIELAENQIKKTATDELGDEQKEAFDYVVERRGNCFITGAAGTGKSRLLKGKTRVWHFLFCILH
jgi:hypothetical protein